MLVVGTFFMGGQDAAPSQCNPAPLAQTSDGKYYAVSSSPSAAPCPKQSHQAAHQQPHTHAVHPAQKTWRRPLMVRQPYSVAVRAPRRSGYIPLLLRRRGLGGRGGAPFGKGDGGIRKKPPLRLREDWWVFESLPLTSRKNSLLTRSDFLKMIWSFLKAKNHHIIKIRLEFGKY